MNPNEQSRSQRLMPLAGDMRAYQQLKEADDMERDATKRLYDSLRRKFGTHEAAIAALKQRGYNPGLIK